jgi:hypothetical protein
MTNGTRLADIAARLRPLVAQPALSPAELTAWYDQAAQFSSYIREHHTDIDLPHFVYHYLSDADIRARKPEYRAEQDRRIEEIVSELERGVLPAETSINLFASPAGRWCGCALACVLGALALRACR